MCCQYEKQGKGDLSFTKLFILYVQHTHTHTASHQNCITFKKTNPQNKKN